MQRGLEELLQENMEIIENVVKPYKRKLKFSAYDCEDLMQEALLGFVESYNSFKGKEEEFIAYAIRAMQYRIKDLIVFQSNKIKIPHRVAKVLTCAKKYDFGFEDAEQIAEITKLPLKTVVDALEWETKKNISSLDELEVSNDGEVFLKYQNANAFSSDLTILTVNEFLDRFDDKTQSIVILAMDETTQKRISEIVKTSQGNISKTLKKMRKEWKIYVME